MKSNPHSSPPFSSRDRGTCFRVTTASFVAMTTGTDKVEEGRQERGRRGGGGGGKEG